MLGAAIGGVGGFSAGGFLGAKIEGNRCNCDDPGFKGFLIGVPIGTVTSSVFRRTSSPLNVLRTLVTFG